jgi:hypothetical protein
MFCEVKGEEISTTNTLAAESPKNNNIETNFKI